MDTALPQKFSFILDRNLAKANCTGNHVCTSYDTVVLANDVFFAGQSVVQHRQCGQFRAQFRGYPNRVGDRAPGHGECRLQKRVRAFQCLGMVAYSACDR